MLLFFFKCFLFQDVLESENLGGWGLRLRLKSGGYFQFPGGVTSRARGSDRGFWKSLLDSGFGIGEHTGCFPREVNPRGSQNHRYFALTKKHSNLKDFSDLLEANCRQLLGSRI